MKETTKFRTYIAVTWVFFASLEGIRGESLEKKRKENKLMKYKILGGETLEGLFFFKI